MVIAGCKSPRLATDQGHQLLSSLSQAKGFFALSALPEGFQNA